MDMKNSNQPLSEVFGFPICSQSERAMRYLKNKLCPFNNIVSNCTKNSIESPLGVCSLNYNNQSVIICPIRFREDWKIMSDAAAFIFEGKNAWTHLGEIKLKDKLGKVAGNIDYVLVSYDDEGRILDFGSLEVQSVYISGNLTAPFSVYLKNPIPDFRWTQTLNYPKPDYLSSSRKRLIPQIIAKGSILKQWNKKQAIALQTTFYDTLPPLPEINQSVADFAFFLYNLEPVKNENRLGLTLKKVVYTKFDAVLEQIAGFEAGSLIDFTQLLQKKLDAKRFCIDNFENRVVE